ncbi:HAD-IIB family hydrolase [Piscibacillus halophilus]|uniref:HAD-IIB family hydrolase n=1 Tax=Piscibacillus halophilus TaxID=571933 RepID=UPI00158C0159|nr:HAD-IIB family hydrolase [Piscibacillus halophilus]
MKFVFDLDGTICFKGQQVSQHIINALLEITKGGHEVIFASARPIRDMLPVIDQNLHHYKMIGGNGSIISKDGEIIYTEAFSPNLIDDIKKLIEKYNATYLIDGHWDYAYTGPSEHRILHNVDPNKLAHLVNVEELDPVIKILILTSNDFEQLENEISQLEVFVNKHKNEKILDISPKGINKWRALRGLGVQKNDYIAFGNDTNDIPIFENALYSVMIGDHEDLSQYANDQIVNKDGLEDEIIDRIQDLTKQYKIK